jgi:Tfp pilus assembly protein PilF
MRTHHLSAAFAASVALSGCAGMQASRDGLFTRAVLEQDVGNDEAAGRDYRSLVALGDAGSAVYNNLAVIAGRRRQPVEARRLLERALVEQPDNVIALTNLGVVEFHLGDRERSAAAFVEAQLRRQEVLLRLPSTGRVNWYAARYEGATAHSAEVARSYLERLARVPAPGVLPSAGDSVVCLLRE